MTSRNTSPEKRVLPNGWEWIQLGDVCDVVARQVSPTLAEYASLPHISAENIESGLCRLMHLRSAAEDGVTSSKYLFDAGDVLYSKLRPYLRKALFVEFAGLCSADIYPIKVDQSHLNPRFAAWLLVSDEFTRYAEEESGRARMPKLNRDQLLRWAAPLPPIAEQQRIVGLLTEQMAAVQQAWAAAKAQLAAALELPSAYLGAMFRNCGFEKWASNGHAIDSKLQGHDGHRDPPAGWHCIPLGDAGEIVSGVTLGRPLGDTPTHRVPYLRVANVKDGRLDLSDVNSIDATETEIRKLRLQHGDLLLTEGGDPDKLGRGTFWEEQIDECIHQNHIFRVRLNQTRFDPQFVSFQIASPYGKSYFLAHAKQTTGIATINQKVLSQFPLLAPSLPEQLRIAAALTEQLVAAERMQAAVETQLTSISRLPAALLNQAFSGAQ